MGCGEKIIYRDKIVREPPSEYLLTPFALRLEPVTYQDYIETYWVDYINLGTSCNARLATIKMEYSDGTH